MNLTFRVELDGAERKFQLLTDSLRKVEPALRVFDKYLRAEVRSRFEQGGPGWPALADATIDHRIAKARHGLALTLGQETRKAKRRFNDRFGVLGLRGDAKARERGLRTLQRRMMTEHEFRAHMRRIDEVTAETFLKSDEGGESPFTAKAAARQAASLKERAGRREKRAVEKHPLGKIVNSFKSTIKNGTLTFESTIKWAGVHNEGGPAGHGATIQARPFLFLTERDLDVLVGILKDRMLLALGG